VTICGPPQVLAQVITSDEFKTSTLVSLPIFAPYHAEHLYKEHDLDSLLGEVGTANLSQTLPIIFSQESGVTHGSDLKKALSVAVRAIFMQCIDIEQLATALGDQLRDKQTSHRLVPIVSGAGPLMQKSLGSESGVHITITKSSLQPLSNNTHDTLSFQSSIRSKIAIVGSSGRFPTADDNGAFWDLLIQGKDVHKPAPASRWDVNTHVDQSEKPRKNTSATSFGCWLENPGLFDAKFFGMSPREAEQVDPAQRLALMAAYEALEDGGIVSGARSSQPSRVGVAFGVTSNDWMETNSAQDIDTYMIPGGNRAFIPGRINYAFKFSGPSYAIDTACSSSLAAIEVACRVLWMQEADTMIAGGTNIITNPDFTAGLDRGRFLSRTGNCKTFDDSADGYCRAEGVGVVILKRLEDALQDGDLVQAVIVNIGTNHSAEANSITRPYPQAQSNLFSRVLNGLSPAKISYVEMHGTGTQVGDAAEMSSVLDAIAPDQGPHRRLEGDICYIGSVKANLGHGEAVAGVTSLVKLLLMMKHSTIPPHVGIKSRLNRKFPKDLAARGIHIAASATPWKRHGSQTRYALLNNFSAAGGNTTLLLEDAPIDNARTTVEDPRPVFPIVISAKSSAALQANTRSILRFLQEQSDTDISSLSYTLSARRLHHFHRLALSGSSASDIVSKLSVALQGAKMRTGTPQQSIMFVFTGQGGHYIGMGRDLYHTNAIFRADVDRYDGLAKMLGFGSFLPLIRDDGGDLAAFGPVETQLAHISLQMALCRLWTSWGVAPSSVMGHSLGHYAALYAAGILSEADSIFAVGIRAQILQSKCQPGTHLMLAVKAGKNVIERLLQGTDLEIACVNGPQDIVISGQRASIEHLEDALSEQNIRSKTLDIQYAFHSSQVECMLEDFGSAIQGITFGIPRIPVLCPRRGTVIRQGESLDRSHLMDHLRGTVDIVSAIEAAEKEGVINNRSHFVEIGYHPAVTTMLKAILGTDCSANGSLKRNLNNWISLTQMTTSLYEAGTNIRWEEFHRDFVANFRIVQVPHYKWDLKNYWIQYVNDWSLYKGNSPRTISSSDRPSPLSRTIHEVVSEDIKDVPGTIVLRSDLSRSELHTIVQGHKVNGLPLCTPSIYADIALTVARYLVKIFPNAFTGKQICIKSMNISKALIAQPKGPQWLRTLVQIEKNHVVTCQFSSVNDDGVVIIHHADCEIGYDSHNSLESMQDQALQTTTAIKNIRADLASGTAYRFNTSMIYRMVATLADFDPAYRGLNEIVLNSHTMAAASKVDFSVLPEDGNHLDFSASPAYIDAFSQLAGFVMNANEASDLGKECFVNHGWGSLTLYENLDRNATYECHVKMEKREGTIWKGTLTVIQEESLIAIFEDLTVRLQSDSIYQHS
jgi:iterative type I PKS product template protein